MFNKIALASTFFLIACGPTTPTETTTDAGISDSGTQDAGFQECAPTTVACEDQMIQQMDLKKNVSTDVITNSSNAGVFTSLAGTNGGGFQPSESYLYAKFTETGLEKVNISDEDSFTNSSWDIAFRRFILRLNSGNSGPSCVAATKIGTNNFDTITAVDPAWKLKNESFMTEDCSQLIDDGSGLGTSPGTRLSPFYTYDGCVRTNGTTFAIQLKSGKIVKLQILKYYKTGQDACNTAGTSGSTAKEFELKWSYLK